jgi:hypothetical protein
VIGSKASFRAASSVVEHLTFNQGVPGSIPGRPTSKSLLINNLQVVATAVLGLGCGWGHPRVVDAQIRWVTRGHNALIVALRASALRRSFSSLTTDVDSGTTCGFAAFMSAAGISHTFVSKRMSVHCIFATRVRSARDALRFSPEVQHRRSGRKAEPRRDRGGAACRSL